MCTPNKACAASDAITWHDLPDDERSYVTVHDQDPYSQGPLDSDPDETAEWQESLEQLVAAKGHGRGREIMLSLLKRSKDLHLGVPMVPTTDYINTIAPENEPEFPGDEEIERRYRAWIRWNAAVTVHRAQRPGIGVGGHISTYASSAALYEVGFNHFFRGADHPSGGDQIFVQGHASPGTYARAFLEGRLTEAQLDGFRQEKSAAPNGIPSYPHPRLMPEFWQFPTVSMGLGPINAIYQAMTNKYLTNRGIKDVSDSHVWAFLGDGEMDEVESRGQLQVAANEGLDNLTFVVNANLQRLDGPVRGNGKIIQELESFFRGAGWNVIKVVWGREWDDLLAQRHRRRAAEPHERHPGRRLPDVQDRERRLRARELLRSRRAHRSRSSRTTATTRSGASSAAVTTTARCTRPTRRPSSTRASPPSSSPRRSRATGSVRTSRGATRRTR